MIVSSFGKWRGKVFYVNVSPDVREPTLMCGRQCIVNPLTQCINISGLRECVSCTSMHRLRATGDLNGIFPNPLWGMNLFFKPVGATQTTLVCVGQEQADTQEFTNLFCLKAPVLHLPPPFLVTVYDWASGTMLVGMDILMYNNHLLRTFTWHISLSQDKIQSRLSIKQVPLSLAKSCLGYLKQPT